MTILIDSYLKKKINSIDSIDSMNSITEERKRKFLAQLAVTQDDVLRIMNIEQRCDAWKDARRNRLTGSVFADVLKHNPYKSPRDFLLNALWVPFTGNEATQYGTENEEGVQKLYEKFITKFSKKKCHFSYPGLIICEKCPWVACSPDGLHQIGLIHMLLEIKCPFWTRRNINKAHYRSIPLHYFDQIQGAMGILNLPFCDFVTWSPKSFQVRRFNFDPVYWGQYMLPQLRKFYMEEYMPRLILKEDGILKHGQIDVVVNPIPELDAIVDEREVIMNRVEKIEDIFIIDCEDERDVKRIKTTKTV